jgi:ABC-2 type transport system ATP-binding protein
VSSAWAIETTALRKSYDGVEAVRGLDLQVPAGSIFGFLGRNGAGKTTTIKLLLGMARPTSGSVRVLGLAADNPEASVDIRRRTGFVSDEKDLFDYMAVGELINFTAPFFPKWRKDLQERYLRKFDLPAGRSVKDLSRGMRTKLALLLALCRGGELLILDEPTSGLDPAMTEEVLQTLVSHVGAEGSTVFFSSHQLAEVDQIADHIAIIDQGRSVVAGPLDEVRENYRRIQFVFEGEAPAAAFATPGVVTVKRKGRVLTVLSSAGSDAIVAEARRLNPVSVDVAPVPLKDIFLETISVGNAETED